VPDSGATEASEDPVDPGAARAVLDAMLRSRLPVEPKAWLDARSVEIAAGSSDDRFAQWISLASRYAPRRPLAPDASERASAAAALPGWNPERWSTLEAVRAALVLARSDLTDAGCERALEESFRYADQGELCALYRSIALLPSGERFAARAAEGCRSNMGVVFEAVACDSPYPVRHFDDIAWRQLAIKAVFIEAPLWRVHGIDTRLSAELARMALDLADERRSAGRPVQPDLWLCLGAHAGERGLESLDREAAPSNPNVAGRRGAVLGLARAGEQGRLKRLEASERDPEVKATMGEALAGGHDAAAFRSLAAGGSSP
jgi:hypothetical protein